MSDEEPRQCEAKTTKGRRCRRNGTRVTLSRDGRLFWVCAEHEHTDSFAIPTTTDETDMSIRPDYEMTSDSASNEGYPSEGEESESKPEDAEETPRSDFPTTPWTASRIEEGSSLFNDAYEAVVWSGIGDHVASVTTQLAGNGEVEEAIDRARLIAAAGTAESELPDEYDAIDAVEALPEMAEATHDAYSALLDVLVEIENGLRPLLKSLHGSTSQDEIIAEALEGLSEDSHRLQLLRRAHRKTKSAIYAAKGRHDE